MIISHEYKFIFIRTHRTGSASFEHIIQKRLFPDDICTGQKKMPHVASTPSMNISPDENGYMTAVEVRERWPEEFENYFVFTIERNPFTKVGSHYCAYYGVKAHEYNMPDPSEPLPFKEKIDFDTYVLERDDFPKDWEAYTDNNKIIVDTIYRQENVKEMYQDISIKTGLNITKPEWYRTRHNSYSKCIGDYKLLYSDRTIDKVANLFYNEMRIMGYEHD